MYTTFNKKKYDHLKQPMFLGESVNVSRYDQQKYNIFEKLIEKQLSFFWRPEEVDISKDRKDFESLSEAEQHIFLSNLKYQTLLDSVQGRSPNVAFLPIVSLPELETWIEVWSFSETIHSRSYTHIIRNIINDPSVVFDSIIDDVNILERADSVTKYYDVLIEKIKNNAPEKEIKKALLLCMVAVNVLEGIRFYVSFACSFAFAERAKMEGNAKIIKLVARDEQLHLTGTQHIINLLQKEDHYIKYLFDVECKDEVKSILLESAEQEKRWCDYLFSKGSMIGLNASILKEYVEYITDLRSQAINIKPIYNKKNNPLPWINSWLSSDNVQVAPQETEITSYLVGSVDSSLSDSDFDDFDL